MKPKAKRDWVGLWYEIAKERGINDLFSFTKINLRTGESEWFEFSHSKMDGIGAMIWLLRQRGLHVSSVPSLKNSKPPAFWVRPFIFLKALRAARPERTPWIENYPVSKTDRRDFSWLIFTREETAKLEELARKRKVSTSALLLEKLNHILIPELAQKATTAQWMFPVNLRGGVKNLSETSNHSSALPIKANQLTRAEQIHDQIREKLKSQFHWASWWLLNLGKVVGVRGVRLLSQLCEKESHWFGTFSNMGNWPPTEMDPKVFDPDEVWVLATPGTKNYPVGVVCVTWNGRFTISLKVHPSVCKDRSRIPNFLAQVKTELFGEKLRSREIRPGLASL